MVFSVPFRFGRSILNRFSCVAFCVLTPTPSMASDVNIDYKSLPGFVRHVRLQSNDQVTDNCWTNAQSIVARSRLLLENNEIQVFDHDTAFSRLFSPLLLLSANGFRSGSLCVGYISVKVSFFGYAIYGGANGKPEYSFRVQNVFFERSSVISSNTNFNAQIDDIVNGSLSEFIADAVVARRDPRVNDFFEAYPSLGEVPMTREEWDKYMDEVMSLNEK